MKFSVITPTHEPWKLAKARESMLAQTYLDWEWVVLVNGKGKSENVEGTGKIKVHVLDKDTDSIGELKKVACGYATGDVLVELDHDDWLQSNCLEALSQAFEDPSVDFAYSDWFEWRDGKTVRPFSEKFGWKYNMQGGQVVTRAFDPDPLAFSYIWFAPNHVRAWRKSFYDRIGGHNSNYDVADDHELLCRTYIHGKCVRVPVPLYNYNVGDNTCYGDKNKKIQHVTRELHDQYIEPMVAKWCDDEGLKKVDLCCGESAPPGYIGVDKYCAGATIKADLDYAWPFENNSVGVFRAKDAVEHLKNPIHTMKEAWRCLAPNGWFLIDVPSTDGRGAFQDPTHCCHDEQTEVFTTKGFVRFQDLDGTELFHVLDPETDRVVELPAEHVHSYDYDGDMIHYKGRHIDALVTPNHGMIVGSSDETTRFRRMDASETLTYASPLRIPSNAQFDGDYPEYFEIPGSRLTLHSNPQGGFANDTVRLPIGSFVDFLGWYISEGCVSINSSIEEGGRYNFYRIQVHQSEKANKEKFDLIGRTLREMGYKPCRTENGWYFNDKFLALWLSKLGKSWEKYIPVSIKQLHPSLLERLLTTLILGDGTKNGAKSSTYATTSSQLAKDVQEVAVKCGYRATVGKEDRMGKSVSCNPDYRAKHDIYLVCVSKSKESYLPRKKEVVDYKGKVYCITVPEHHVVMTRRNGRVLWSGNSFWNSNSFWYYTNRNYARFIGTPVKFQCNRLVNHFPGDYFRDMQIPYVRAHLVKLADDNYIPPRGRDI